LPADDHRLLRRGLRLILDGEPDLDVVADAGDGGDAVHLAARPSKRAAAGYGLKSVADRDLLEA
jgi:DNA-binding NarL/FixJ family response regulator